MKELLYRIAFLILVVAVLMLLGANVLRSEDNPPPISLLVTPRFLTCIPSQRPWIRMQVTIERHPDNHHRSLSWSAVSGESGTSINEMEGEKDARIFERLQEVSCDSYTITACVYRNKQKFCDNQEVLVPERRWLVRPFKLHCPTCRQVMVHFTEIIFLDNFKVVVEGVCCGHVVTSGEIDILSLLPLKTAMVH
jgi:hypothetical protein